MAIPWGTIQSLALFFGPLVLPRLISFYRTARNSPRAHGLSPRPLPPLARRALYILLITGTISTIYAILPPLAPENVFRLTQSRLQAPADVLFARLATVTGRSASSVARDAALRTKFANLESRLLYCQFGPAALADCAFCSVADNNDGSGSAAAAMTSARMYLLYSLPDLALPHLLNLAALTGATSPLLCGREPASWRAYATAAALALAAADLWLVVNYNPQTNSRSGRLGEIDFFYWTQRARRLAGLGVLDFVTAGLQYLTATQRAFAMPAAGIAAARVEGVVRALAGARNKLNAAGVVKNTAMRDEALRGRAGAYWRHEVGLMRDVMEDRDVVAGVNDALANRIDVRTVERDAEAYAREVLDVSGAVNNNVGGAAQSAQSTSQEGQSEPEVVQVVG